MKRLLSVACVGFLAVSLMGCTMWPFGGSAAKKTDAACCGNCGKSPCACKPAVCAKCGKSPCACPKPATPPAKPTE